MSQVVDIVADRKGSAPGRASSRRGDSMRRCLASRESRPKNALLRFVVGPSGDIVPDLEENLPGRGLWLTPRREMIEVACAKGLFARAARRPVTTPDDLPGRVGQLLSCRCLHFLGLARRAGVVVTGTEKVRQRVKQGRVAVLVTASDGSEDGLRKLANLLPETADVPVIRLFEATKLSEAVGQSHVVYAAVAPGAVAERLIAEAERLAEYEGVDLLGHVAPGKTQER